MAATVHRSLALALVLALVAGCGSESASGPDGPATPTVANQPASTDVPRASVSPAVPVPPAGPTSASSPAESQRPPAAGDVPSRVVITALDIDLPVVSGDLMVEGNPRDYPLCDVAQYLTTYRYPGRPATTTWIYAHARQGMFLPLLEASTRDDGEELVGVLVTVYSTADLAYSYRLTDVRPHSTDRTVAADVPEGEGRLVLQTSEGPSGTVPKLQVVGVLESVKAVSEAEARPDPAPRVCG